MKLSETISNISTDGIFKALSDTGNFSFINPTNYLSLDTDYYFGHSGNKEISPLMNRLKDTTQYINTVANIVSMRFGDNWRKIYDAYFIREYNPIENYSMTESENAKSKILTTAENNTEVYAFNSVEGVPTGKTDGKQVTEGESNDNQRQLSRSGNIGVTTSQQMLESEITLRKFDFYTMIYNDIDKVMTLSIYK